MKRVSPWLLWLLPIVSGALFVAGWYAVRAIWDIQSWVLPTPAEIFQTLGQERERLLPAASRTLMAMIGGFLSASVAGFVIGLALGGFQPLRFALQPWLTMVQMTPVIILAPIIVIWLEAGMRGIITVTFLISFFPIVVNMTHGLVSTDKNHVALFRMCSASRWQELMLLRVPSAMPNYLAGLQIAASLAPIGAITGEYLAGNSSGGSGGLGFLVYSYNAQINIPALFATGLTGCLLGFIFVAAVATLRWAVLRKWHESFERNDH
jgi:NitT/TauT family transport system permease protein